MTKGYSADGHDPCPTCDGTGGAPCGRCENDQDGFEDFPCHDPYPCPDCIEGYPKDRIERAAKAGYEAWWEGKRRPLELIEDTEKQLWIEQTVAAIRAFHDQDQIT